MKRYFYIRDQEMTAELTIDDGSKASTAPIEAFEQYFNSKEVQELTYEQYQKIHEDD